MEASTLNAPALSRLGIPGALLKLRSDEQLVALFRAGSEEAFAVIHDRYRQRLFAYVRQMLSATSRQDAEDVLQDVFMRAYGALRSDTRDVNLRAWLYRVAHNRCIDHLRRPTPPDREVFEMSRRPLHDPIVEAQRREDLKRLVEDVGRLPDQQRSALLMREIDGISYADIAEALDVTVPAVKSLLVRARVGLVESIEARETSCETIREDLTASYDRGVKSSARARKHMRECAGCREYRGALKSMRKQFAALSPIGAFAPAAVLAKLLGAGGAGAGGGAAVTTGTATVAGTATACKVAAVVCTAAITAGGAVEMKRMATDPAPQPKKSSAVKRDRTPAAAAAAAAVSTAAVPLGPKVLGEQSVVVDRAATSAPARPAERESAAAATPLVEVPAAAAPVLETPAGAGTGGAAAPEDAAAPQTPTNGQSTTGNPQSTTTTSPSTGTGTAEAPAAEGEAQQSASSSPASSEPPPEH